MAAPPTLGGVPSKNVGGPSTRTKHRRSKNGASRSHVPADRYTKPGGKATANPPLHYTVGPYDVKIVSYRFRFWALRGNKRDRVQVPEVEAVTWDDSSALMTGSLTVRSPWWAKAAGIVAGHQIIAEVSSDGGRTFSPLWRMRVQQPNIDIGQHERTFNLVNDLARLQGDDDFVFAKDKAHPRGWRVDEVIRWICNKYGIRVAALPRMTARITNWHLIDQRPLDVIHSALLREKKATGRKYAVSLDANGALHVYPFRRPRQLLQVGPTLLAATLATELDPRFATAVTVRAASLTKVTHDQKGHRKVRTIKIAADVRSASGVALYGFIHRNLYSPDAESNADARKEGKLFLAAIAKPDRSFKVALPGMPFLRRLDAMRFRLGDPPISQIVYVSDANHTYDGASGYSTEATLSFDDPFVDNKQAAILSKLSDTAVARSRKTTTAKKTPPKPKTSKPRSTAPSKPPPSLGGVPTKPKTAKRKSGTH